MHTALRNQNQKRSGQAMLIAVLSLGGAILGATTVAGLLTLYQIRATTDTENSAKAVFAADAGTEWARFNYYCSTDSNGTGGNRVPSVVPGVSEYPTSSFSDSEVGMVVNCYSDPSASGQPIPCSSTSTVAVISTGVSIASERAFFLGISNATSTTSYP